MKRRATDPDNRFGLAMPRLRLLAALMLLCATAFCGEKHGPLTGKLDWRLIPAIESLHNGSATPHALARSYQLVLDDAAPALNGGAFMLELDIPKLNAQILKQIAATGALIHFSSAQWNSVIVEATLEQLDALTQIPAVRSAKLQIQGMCGAGLVTTQVDASARADVLRSATGLTGAGQKVGVLSDTVNATKVVGNGTTTGGAPGAVLTGTNPQGSGDLPDAIQVVDFGTLTTGTDEGEGMLEIVHDIAPGASLAFGTAFGGLTRFASNVLQLRAIKCTVICDDVFYPGDPMFQDGPVAQAMNKCIDDGIVVFTLAGNHANQGIMGFYNPITPDRANDDGIRPPTGDDYHNWGNKSATPQYLPIDIPAGVKLRVALQWNQPFLQYNLGVGSSVDLDLYLYDSNLKLLQSSEEAQFSNGKPGGDPFEYVEYENTAKTTTRVNLALNHHAGARANTFFRIVFIQNGTTLSFPEGGVSQMTVYGHSACKAITCGAINFADIDSGGLATPDTTAINAEPFSSLGGLGDNGVPFFFDTKGDPVPGGILRVNKPDIAAPDNGNTAYFGRTKTIVLGGKTYDDDSFPNFSGTSASTPAAAAVGALLLERCPASTTEQIRHALQSTARDIVASNPLSVAGPDPFTGAGLIDANAAAASMPLLIQGPTDAKVGRDLRASFSVSADGPAIAFQWQSNGEDIPGENAGTLSLKNIAPGMQNNLYRCVISNLNGTIKTNTAKLIFTPPTLLSPLAATPANARVSASVSFVSSVQSAYDAPITYTFDFGDGTSSITAESSTSHAYTNQGIYTTTLAAADHFGATVTSTTVVNVFNDPDNDGRPDVDPASDNTAFPDLAAVLLKLQPQPFTVKKLSISLSFAKASSDSLSWSGSLSLPPGFVPARQKIQLVIGGYGRIFTLDAKGRANKQPDCSLNFKANTKTNTATYTLTARKSALQQYFVDEKLTNRDAKDDLTTVRVSMFLANTIYDLIQPQNYTAKKGKSGKTK